MSVYPAALPTVRPAVRSAFEQGSGGGAASIIAGLFSAGQQGFWLPFTDFASLSQDSAGTLPYIALEQPVGLIYDKSRGGALGTELVLNGDFDTNSSWSIGAGIAISDGKWRATDAIAANPSSLQNTGASVSGMVKVTLIVSEYVSGVVFLRMYTPSAVAADTPLISANGTYSFLLQTNGWDGRIGLRGNGGTTLAVDSLSIKQVLGNHASQPTSTARGVVSARVNLLNNSEMLGSVAGAPGSPPTSWETHIFTGGGVQMLEGLKPRFVATGGRASIKGGVVWQPNVVYDVIVKLENHQATAQSPTNLVLVGTVTATGQSTQIYVDGVLGAAIPPGVSTVRITTSYTGGTALNYLYLGAGASGTATADVTIFSADVRFANQSSLPYQRVTTATDYDSVGFPKYLTFDGVDDRLQATLPAITGTWIVGYKEGTLVYKVNIPAGTLPIGTNTNAAFYTPSKNFVGMVLRAGDLTDVEVSAVERYLVANGAGAAGVDAFAGVSSFFAAWTGCSSLTSFPLINTAKGTSFQSAWSGCASLTSFPSNMFDSCPATNFSAAFQNCALSQVSVDGILASLVTAGKSNGTLNMHSGTSSTPSAGGLASKATLESRGWTVTHN